MKIQILLRYSPSKVSRYRYKIQYLASRYRYLNRSGINVEYIVNFFFK